MHCYRYLAATMRIADTLESLPETEDPIPLGVLADWMEENGIEADEVLAISGEEVRAIVERVIHANRPQLPNAA
jgi:(p)ppGpp synthase/HD superfamily hydrolase